MAKKGFSEKIKIKCLLCCDRHCCLCGKQCSTNIEIHHILPKSKKGENSFENAISLCFDCHAKVELYNQEHPKGNKYRYEELKSRRNQVYDTYTSPLVPNIRFEIRSFEPFDDPYNARFNLTNTHQYLPCKVQLIFSIYSKKKLLHKFKDGCYGGEINWNLNPNSGGNFPPNFLHIRNMPKKVEDLRVQIEATIIDKFNWKHQLLPVSWVWGKESKGWYFHPFLK